MKKVFTFYIAFTCQLYCVAQIVPSNIDALKIYYQQNIQDLKPLEGIYSWAQKWTSPITGTVRSSGSKAFFYSKQHNKYIALYFDNSGRIRYRLDRGVNYIFNESSHILCLDDGRYPNKIDDTNYFVTHEVWSSGDYTERVYHKIYPTPEMYEEANIESKIEEAGNLIKNGFYSSALAILDGVLKMQENPKGYYLRAGAYYGLKNIRAAIQDCNKALSYNINTNNASAVYYLRGLCHFLIEDEDPGILDMKRAGEDGLKFLEENGYTSPQSAAKQKNNNAKNPTKKNQAPSLMKTK